MFYGHKMYKLGKNWVFDLSTFNGYKVEFKGDRIDKVYLAFSLSGDDYNNIRVIKYIKVPFKIINLAKRVVRSYYKEALVYVGGRGGYKRQTNI